MLTLGHIIYSNCYPPHAGLISGTIPHPFAVVEGIPSELNRLLRDGKITVSPSSSIAYAMNPGRYLLLPDLSITSRKEVRSIILQSRVPIENLGGKAVGLTSASATSVVLLKILFSLRYRIAPAYITFDQGVNEPFGSSDALLFIGDRALKAAPSDEYPYLYDLGLLWSEFTGLPFVFALWQVNYNKKIDKELALLYDMLMQSKAYGLSRIPELAEASKDRFGLPVGLLVDYWRAFSYNLTGYETRGLLTFYSYAAEIGLVAPVKELRFWERA